jgi:tetratricopeptide (TPR) repeat protein
VGTFIRNAAYVNNLALWQAAVDVNPHHARAWNNLAGAYRTLKAFEQSQACFEKALSLKPDEKYALTQLPRVLATLSKSESPTASSGQAIELAVRLITLFPDQPRHRLSLIKLLDKLGHHERAEQECVRLIADLQPTGALAKKTQKRPRWDIPTLDGNPVAETHFHWAEALAVSDATVYFQQGVVLSEMQQTAKAMEKYRQAIQCEASHEAAWNNLAMLLAREGRTQEASHAYRQALYWKPNYPEALDNYGNLYARAQQYREAIALYERALQVDAEYQPAQAHLAAARRRLENE